MSKYTAPPIGRGKLRCSSCKSVVPPKDGDWFVAPDASGQVFLCKTCESKAKDHKRAVLAKH